MLFFIIGLSKIQLFLTLKFSSLLGHCINFYFISNKKLIELSPWYNIYLLKCLIRQGDRERLLFTVYLKCFWGKELSFPWCFILLLLNLCIITLIIVLIWIYNCIYCEGAYWGSMGIVLLFILFLTSCKSRQSRDFQPYIIRDTSTVDPL